MLYDNAGTVTKVDPADSEGRPFFITYSDGDAEWVSLRELRTILLPASGGASGAAGREGAPAPARGQAGAAGRATAAAVDERRQRGRTSGGHSARGTAGAARQQWPSPGAAVAATSLLELAACGRADAAGGGAFPVGVPIVPQRCVCQLYWIRPMEPSGGEGIPLCRCG